MSNTIYRSDERTGPGHLAQSSETPHLLTTRQMSHSTNPAHRGNPYSLRIENSNANDNTGNEHNIDDNRANTANLDYANVFDLLREHFAFNTAFNSAEREVDDTSLCMKGTRTEVLHRISLWAEAETDGRLPFCWLEGPAGSGKSTIARTIAQQYADQNRLAFSYFFSRGKPDRNDTRKFFPTFAYHLAAVFQAMQIPLHNILTTDRSIPTRDLRTQFQNLIITPSSTINTSSYLVVIDGLDECGDDFVCEVVELLLETLLHGLQFRFLFTSRPETHLVAFFKTHSSQILPVSLRDFNTDDDICVFLQQHLGEILQKRRNLMRDVPRPWPSQHDLDILVRKSEHLFIYVSTLVKYVGEQNGLPQRRLQAALESHTGLDPMYEQILSLASEYEDFDRVVGAIVFLVRPLPVGHLAHLLQLEPIEIRFALHGCRSILMIPDTDDRDTIHPYHASLRDFLTNANRSRSFAMPLLKHNVNILACCMKMMVLELGKHTSPPSHLLYPCQYWMHHFVVVFNCGGSLGQIEAGLYIEVLGCIETCLEWRKQWMHGLGSNGGCDTAIEQCSKILSEQQVGSIWHSVL